MVQLGIPFADFNPHKWIGTPLTLSFMYIAPERLADMDGFHYPGTDVRARTHCRMSNFPALMTLLLAFEEHRTLSGEVG